MCSELFEIYLIHIHNMDEAVFKECTQVLCLSVCDMHLLEVTSLTFWLICLSASLYAVLKNKFTVK